MHDRSQAPVEYLTIIATSAAEAMEQFARRGLAAEGYAIAGQIGRHQVVRGDRGVEPLAEGMVAATFRRSVDTP